MSIKISSMNICGVDLGKNNPLPYLRDPKWDKKLNAEGLKPKQKVGLGYSTGDRVLPYTVYDQYSRDKRPIDIKTIVMENDFMRAVFLPDYGGRLYSLFDKVRQKELLFKNPVFQFCNIGTRLAWFSGGIEWNVGQYGHSTLTCDPMYFAICSDDNGEEFLRMYEYERIKGVFLKVDFHLPKDEKYLYAHVNIYNSHDKPTSLYWWTNTAVELNRNMRVLSGNSEIILNLPNGGSYDLFLNERMPKPKAVDGIDVSYPENCPFSMEYFYQNKHKLCQTWEASAYNDGSAFFERSTCEMPYRKMFCWSNKAGGQHWQNFLAQEGAPFYTEIQSGIYPTQCHGGDMPAKGNVCFTQAFGGFDMDSDKTHADDYDVACGYTYDQIEKCISEKHLLKMHSKFQACENASINEVLHSGSGWGALEQKREPDIVPQGLVFSEKMLGEEEYPFLMLLEKGTMPNLNGGLPKSYMCDSRWIDIMQKAINESKEESPELLLHYAIASYENGNVDEGINTLKRAMENSSAPIISRTLGMVYSKLGDKEKAVKLTRKSINNGGLDQSHVFAIDYLKVLIDAEYYIKAWDFFESLSEEIKNFEQIQVLVSVAAYETQRWSFLESQFNKEFVYMREGETQIIDLWFKYRAKELVKSQNIELSEALKIVQENETPPYEIDFGVYTKFEE